jgi:glycosyltransferase involved in cell wall biosynthesis
MAGMSSAYRLSVLIPVYNEVATLRVLLERVMAVPLRKELIIVDDFSTDGTRTVLEDFRRDHPDTDENTLHLVFQPYNQGKGAAIRTAVRHITGEYAVIQDADLEYDPAEYPRLLQPILDGHADVVFGSRFTGSPRRVLMYWHTLGNQLLTWVSNMCTNLNLTDMETCYKVFKSDILKRIPLRSNRFGIEPELTAKVSHLRCRIYEVPISYHGRQYAEGKKIGWKDAVSALWTILRFMVFPDIGREDAGFTTLRRVEGLQRYNAFMWSLMRPWIGRRVLEVGAGTGLLTKYLLSSERLLTTDLDADYVEWLSRTYADRPNVEVRQVDLATLAAQNLNDRGFDTVVCANVLEHIEDDDAALRSMRALLIPGGRVVLVVPAIKALYGSIDQAIHHYRRYAEDELRQKLAGAGLEPEHIGYFNMLGVPGWYLNAVLLRRRTVPSIQARINDWLVPLLRLEQKFGPPIGMSLVAVARVPR